MEYERYQSIKVLIYGMPGSPIIDLADSLSNMYDIDFITVERNPENLNGYFVDNVPEVRFDVGDFQIGSGSQRRVRDPGAERKGKELGRVEVPSYDTPLSREEKSEILEIQGGIVATEVPDPFLAVWATHVVFLKVDVNDAIKWFKGRRKCFSCGSIYHIKDRPPMIPAICDRCGTDLKRKREDHPTVVRKQYKVWKEDFQKLEEFARKDKSTFFFEVDLSKVRRFSSIMRFVDRWLDKEVPKVSYYWPESAVEPEPKKLDSIVG